MKEKQSTGTKVQTTRWKGGKKKSRQKEREIHQWKIIESYAKSLIWFLVLTTSPSADSVVRRQIKNDSSFDGSKRRQLDCKQSSDHLLVRFSLWLVQISVITLEFYYSFAFFLLVLAVREIAAWNSSMDKANSFFVFISKIVNF